MFSFGLKQLNEITKFVWNDLLSFNLKVTFYLQILMEFLVLPNFRYKLKMLKFENKLLVLCKCNVNCNSESEKHKTNKIFLYFRIFSPKYVLVCKGIPCR